jgi:hypothetical protein
MRRGGVIGVDHHGGVLAQKRTVQAKKKDVYWSLPSESEESLFSLSDAPPRWRRAAPRHVAARPVLPLSQEHPHVGVHLGHLHDRELAARPGGGDPVAPVELVPDILGIPRRGPF